MPEATTALIFEDRAGLGAALADRLRQQGHQVITVKDGRRYRAWNDGTYAIDPRAAQDYTRLIAALAHRHAMPSHIYHLWTVTEVDDVPTLQALGMSSLTFLALALGQQPGDVNRPVGIAVVSDRVQRVGQEGGTVPAKATVLGPCRIIPCDDPRIALRHVDIQLPTRHGPAWASLCDMLAAELTGMDKDNVVAYRASERWVRTWAPLPGLTPEDALTACNLKTRGIYLVTGDLAGFGLALTGHLAQACDARLAVIVPEHLPPRVQWAAIVAGGGIGPVAMAIRHIQIIESAGAEIITLVADASNPRDMTRAIRQIRAHWGPVDGVFHMVDVQGKGHNGGSTDRQLPVACRKVLALDMALCDEQPDFLLLLSSCDGPAKFSVEAAATHAFLDAYAQNRREDTTHVAVIEWSGWENRPMASDAKAAHGDDMTGPPEAMDHPFLQTLYRPSPGELVAEGVLSPQHPWLMDEQRLADGDTLLSVTGLVELVRATLASVHPGPCEMRDVVLLSPFAAIGRESRTLRVHLDRCDQAGWRFAVVGQTVGQEAWISHARGLVSPLNKKTSGLINLKAAMARCVRIDAVDDCSLKDAGLHRPLLRQSWVGKGEAVIDLVLDQPGGQELLPGVLDCAIAATRCLLGNRSHDDVIVAASMGSVRLYGPLPRHLFALSRVHGVSEDRTAMIGITLTDPDGRLIVQIEGLTMFRVAHRCWQRAIDRHASRPGKKPGFPASEGLRIIHQVLGRAHAAHLLARSHGESEPLATTTEQLIGDVWGDLSHGPDLTRDSDVMASGNHPLVCLHGLRRLGERTHKTLTLDAMLQTTTVAALASMVDALADGGRAGIDQGTIPLFLIHDGSGTTTIYDALIAKMANERPVLGIEPDRDGDRSYAHSRVTEMARAYISRMRKVQPHGPYLLAGLDAGGVIAFDMACQLQAMGERAALVAVIDGADVETRERGFRLFRAGLPMMGKRLSHFPRLWEQARRAHRPQGALAGGEVIVFKATQGTGPANDRPASARYTDRLLGWGKRVAGEVAVIALPGGHQSAMQDPNVEVLAQALRDAIARAMPEEAVKEPSATPRTLAGQVAR